MTDSTLDSSVQTQKLPNSSGALVLGILSIVGCMCYGIIGLVCGIIAVVLANKSLKLYKQSPERYSDSNLGMFKAGKICGIIGIILSALMLIYLAIIISMFGLNTANMFEQIMELQEQSESTYDWEDEGMEDYNWEEEMDQLETEEDLDVIEENQTPEEE